MENKEQILNKADTISKTYKEVAKEYIGICQTPDPETKETIVLTSEQIAGIDMFAEYLDSSNVLSDKFTVLALMSAREIDREVLLALVDVIGIDKAREIIQKIYDGHMHTKKKENESNDVPKVSEQAS